MEWDEKPNKSQTPNIKFMSQLWHILDKQWQPREVRAGPIDSDAQVRLCAGAAS